MRTKPKTNGHSRETVGIDDLTGVWNQAGFIAAATPIFRSCQRREAPIALAYFDFYSTDSSISLTQDPTIDRVLDGDGRADAQGVPRLRPRRPASSSMRFAVLLPDCTDDALAAVAGVRALTDGSTSRLALAAGMVRNIPGGTFDDLMFAADTRTKQIKREQQRRAERSRRRARPRNRPNRAASASRCTTSPSRAAIGRDDDAPVDPVDGRVAVGEAHDDRVTGARAATPRRRRRRVCARTRRVPRSARLGGAAR